MVVQRVGGEKSSGIRGDWIGCKGLRNCTGRRNGILLVEMQEEGKGRCMSLDRGRGHYSEIDGKMDRH